MRKSILTILAFLNIFFINAQIGLELIGEKTIKSSIRMEMLDSRAKVVERLIETVVVTKAKMSQKFGIFMFISFIIEDNFYSVMFKDTEIINGIFAVGGVQLLRNAEEFATTEIIMSEDVYKFISYKSNVNKKGSVLQIVDDEWRFQFTISFQ